MNQNPSPPPSSPLLLGDEWEDAPRKRARVVVIGAALIGVVLIATGAALLRSRERMWEPETDRVWNPIGLEQAALLSDTDFRAAPVIRSPSPDEPAVSAYRDLEFDRAASLLRRVLAPPLATELADTARAGALTYLAAAEHYRGQPDSATAVFRRLVELAPDAQPDTLVFPPEVTELYHAVRRSMTVVAVRPRPDTVPARTPPVARDTLPAASHPAPPPPPPPQPPPPPAATAPVRAPPPGLTGPR